VDLRSLTMRTRSKVLPYSESSMTSLAFSHYNNGSTSNSTVSINQKLINYKGTETIIDDPSPGRYVKQLSHYRIEKVMRPASTTTYGSPTVNNTYTGLGASWNQWNSPYPSGGHELPDPSGSMLAVSDTSQDALVRDTVDAFYQDNEVDNLLNLVEAPQLLDSLKTLSSSVRLWLSRPDPGIRTWTGLRKSFTYRDLKRKLKRFGSYGSSASSGYLMYSFGFAPIISDMLKVQSSYHSLWLATKKALKSRGKLVSIHRSSNIALSYAQPGGGSASTLQTSWLLFRLSREAGRRTCTVRGIRSHGYHQASFNKLDYLLTRFGATGPASLAWELIPYSFVVDWFLDLRHITNTLDNLLTGGYKSIVDICVSDKIVVAHNAYLSQLGYNPWNNGEFMGTVRVNSYTRSPVTSYQKIGLSGRFGKKQASLAAALIYQNVANRVR
jgi:hypothetical protein